MARHAPSWCRAAAAALSVTNRKLNFGKKKKILKIEIRQLKCERVNSRPLANPSAESASDSMTLMIKQVQDPGKYTYPQTPKTSNTAGRDHLK